MIFKKRIPNEIISTLVKRYEEEALFLSKNNEYYSYKELLISKRKVSTDEFKKFIIRTRNDRYTSFDCYRVNKNFNSNFQIDVKFKNFLYIKFTSFQNASTKFIDYISKTSLPFLIIDLRDNIGGNVDECVKIANSLLPNNYKIVNLEYRRKKVSYLSDEYFKKFERIFVFVNEYTMSSAEILALTLKTNLSNIFVLGNKTFCKDIGQTTYINKKHNYIFNISTFKWDVNGYHSADIVDTKLNEHVLQSDDYYRIMLSKI